jgi:uncharacterized small protein (DUF1192 family)
VSQVAATFPTPQQKPEGGDVLMGERQGLSVQTMVELDGRLAALQVEIEQVRVALAAEVAVALDESLSESA